MSKFIIFILVCVGVIILGIVIWYLKYYNQNYDTKTIPSTFEEDFNKIEEKQYFPYPIHGHYDPRFYKYNLNAKDCHKELYKLLYKFNDFYKGDYWLAYGTLLGGIRHNGIIPWDDDIDLHVWAKDLKNNPNFETDEYIWFVVPTAHSEEIDKLNGIDARLISKKYGLFVDIMALHPKKDYDIIKHESVGGEKKRKRKILPFLKVKFGDIKCNVANDYMNDLQFLYGNNCLTHDLHGKRLNLPIVEKPI